MIINRFAQPGDIVYILQGFDILNCHWFIANPAIMLTEEEAKEYCKTNSTRTLSLGYKPVRMGGMELKKMPKRKIRNTK